MAQALPSVAAAPAAIIPWMPYACTCFSAATVMRLQETPVATY